MEEKRRSFLKKAAIVGAVSTVATVAAVASSKNDAYDSNGVVVGHSNKKEILYKKTKAWDDFYRVAL